MLTPETFRLAILQSLRDAKSLCSEWKRAHSIGPPLTACARESLLIIGFSICFPFDVLLGTHKHRLHFNPHFSAQKKKRENRARHWQKYVNDTTMSFSRDQKKRGAVSFWDHPPYRRLSLFSLLQQSLASQCSFKDSVNASHSFCFGRLLNFQWDSSLQLRSSSLLVNLLDVSILFIRVNPRIIH